MRSSCHARLDVLCAMFGEDSPYRGGLDEGFAFRGQRVPFLSPQKGIFRAAAQRGPAALSINTTGHGSALGHHRWVVERTFAWLHNRRRPLVRTDRRDDIHEGFLALTCCLICWRRLETSLS